MIHLPGQHRIRGLAPLRGTYILRDTGWDGLGWEATSSSTAWNELGRGESVTLRYVGLADTTTG